MPGSEEVIVVRKSKPETQRKAEDSIASADIIFCLDFNALKRIESLENPVRVASAIKIMIDHHLEPENFAQFSFWDVKSASTAGLIFQLIENLNDLSKIDASVANCLYAGLMTDTGGFRHNNTGVREFEIAAKLTLAGAVPHQVAANIYDSNSLNRLRLTGFVQLQKLTVLKEFKTAYICLSKEELNHYEAQTGDTEGLVNMGLSVEGVRLSVLMHDREGEVKLSFRSTGDFSVNDLARKYFSGGGHRNAAGGSSKDSLQQTLERFIALLPQYQNELNNR
jgi:phosphoesterase RecJ-like protein